MTINSRKVASYVGAVLAITFGWLLYVEAVCFVRLWAADPGTDLIPRDRLRQVYKNADWVDAFADEWKPSNAFAYKAYVGWERKPFKGRAININEVNMRVSAHSHCDGDAYTIWMFGGSTVWGAGTPDWSTIPSQLAEMYEQDGRKVCVHNYGQQAWVNSQEVVKLTLELKASERKPDLVIFYDGPGDVYETYQSGKAGLHQNFDSMASMFERRTSAGGGGFQYLLNTNTARILMQSNQQARMDSRKDPNLIAQASLRNYMDNVRFVQILAREYGFEPAFFWQPTISMGHKRLTAEEQAARDAASKRSPGLEEANQAAYMVFASDCKAPLFCMVDVFDEAGGTIYFDDAHVDAEGNRLIAKRMYQALHRQPDAARSMASTSAMGSPTTLK